MLIKHWREQFINIAEDHSVHSHKRRELCYFNHVEKKSLPPFHIKHRSVHSEHPCYCTQVPLRTPVLHDATKLHYCVQLTYVQAWLTKCLLNPCLWCHAPVTLETTHLCIINRAPLTRYSDRCLYCRTSVPLESWHQQVGSKPCLQTTVLVLTAVPLFAWSTCLTWNPQ